MPGARHLTCKIATPLYSVRVICSQEGRFRRRTFVASTPSPAKQPTAATKRAVCGFPGLARPSASLYPFGPYEASRLLPDISSKSSCQLRRTRRLGPMPNVQTPRFVAAGRLLAGRGAAGSKETPWLRRWSQGVKRRSTRNCRIVRLRRGKPHDVPVPADPNRLLGGQRQPILVAVDLAVHDVEETLLNRGRYRPAAAIANLAVIDRVDRRQLGG